MTSTFYIGTSKLAYSGFVNRLYKISKTCNVTQAAFVSSKAKRVNLPPRPPPFPYLEKKYTVYHHVMDPMMYRFDENSVVISVEGPPAVGKTKFAKKLAEELDMFYVTPPTFDTLYIDQYNFDIRTLDKHLPESCQTCDVKKFLTNPYFQMVTAFQFHYYTLKFERYMKALLHVLSTGQGVVFERSPHTDVVFMEAMVNAGYVRKIVLKRYHEVLKYTLSEVPAPHLFIYLDTPVSEVKKKIQQRNVDFEVNSKVLTTEYLTDIENVYKQRLKTLSKHSHFLMYDWTEPGDVMPVVEDIEDIDFQDFKAKNMEGWNFHAKEAVVDLRYNLVYNDHLLDRCVPESLDCPELFRPAEDSIIKKKVMEEFYEKHPDIQYMPGFNKGEKWFWKSLFTYYDPLQPREVPPEKASKLG